MPKKKAKLPLSKTNPELAKEAHGWDPSTVTPGSGKKLAWRCKYGHITEVIVRNRANKNYGCPICSNKKVLAGFNDLGTTHPEIAKEAFGWDPKLVISGSNKTFWWKCRFGHTWEAPAVARTFKKSGCPICSNRKIQAGVNDLKTTHSTLSSQAYKWDTTKYIAGSEEIKEWICKFGHIWNESIYKRAYREYGCTVCSGRKLLVGFNDLKTKFPLIAAEAHGWDPSELISGYGKHMDWKCSNGHIWSAEVSKRTSGGNGCPTCGKYGFTTFEPGWLYLMDNEKLDMLKIGISNVPDIRMAMHKRTGWKVSDVRGPMDGDLAKNWESAILRMLKAKGADLSNSKIAGKFDGYSEAWSKSTFPVKSIKELMQFTEEYEDNK